MANLTKVAIALVILAVTFVVDRLVRRALSRYGKRLDLEPHAINILKLIARIVVFAAGVVALLIHFNFPAEWFISISALTGAAIGFASTQTVGNFLAGLYLMISRPFMVRDYVKIGDVEGEVKEITINYTKIYTPTYNITEIPNRKVLDSIILNYSGKKDIIDYSFPMGFPHLENITNEELIAECIKPTIEKFYEKHKDVLPKKPEASMSNMDRLGRDITIRMFFPEGKTNEFYDLQPVLLQDIVTCWDALKAKKAS
ncbi:MAG: mechanosensitive ion channel [Candidatus Bathyarchaeum sp.]|nr:MAG: mechanosensitive ion channel [Candidatus Bathyarchaeum sp.]